MRRSSTNAVRTNGRKSRRWDPNSLAVCAQVCHHVHPGMGRCIPVVASRLLPRSFPGFASQRRQSDQPASHSEQGEAGRLRVEERSNERRLRAAGGWNLGWKNWRKHPGRNAWRKQSAGDLIAPAIASTKPEQAAHLGEQPASAAATAASASRSQQAQGGASCQAHDRSSNVCRCSHFSTPRCYNTAYSLLVSRIHTTLGALPTLPVRPSFVQCVGEIRQSVGRPTPVSEFPRLRVCGLNAPTR